MWFYIFSCGIVFQLFGKACNKILQVVDNRRRIDFAILSKVHVLITDMELDGNRDAETVFLRFRRDDNSGLFGASAGFPRFDAIGATGAGHLWGILALVCGTLAMAAVMIPANLFITPIFMGAPRAAVAAMLPTAIIPFNLLKAGINSIVTFLLYKRVSPLLHK